MSHNFYKSNSNRAREAQHLARLQNAIRRLNGCESKYIKTVPVCEAFLSFSETKVWQGEVAVFEIYGHSQANHAYAWSSMLPNKERTYVVVLEVPPVRSPETAVQAALAAQIVNGNLR